jgi:uncharacterized membrane protein YphA (DoxX/SURF4 family)
VSPRVSPAERSRRVSTAFHPLVDADERLLRRSAALVWLLTATLVLTPTYRAEGLPWLARLGLGAWPMYLTCVAELVLGVRVWLRPSGRALLWLQVLTIAGFTVTLAALEPRLLAHPFGVLSKNVGIVGVLAAAHVVAAPGPRATARATLLLRASLAVVWLWEGLGPKLLLVQAEELRVLEHLGLGREHAMALVHLAGVGEVLLGLLTLTLHGRALRGLLSVCLALLLLLPALVTLSQPELWLHPFGPLTKNVVLIAATSVLWRRCSATSR